MKKIKSRLNNIFVFTTFIMLVSNPLFAEEMTLEGTEFSTEKNDEKGIELPDLTTIVTGADMALNSEVIPDFDDVIIVDNIQSNFQLDLPDVVFDETNSSVFLPSVQVDKGIYAEGKIGAGYPGSFIGEFSIMQDRGVSPFEIFYSHTSFDGYNGNALYSGYNDNETTIKLDRTLNFNKSNLNFGGFYETYGNGLQNKVSNVSAVNMRDINATIKYDYNIIDTLNFGSDFTADYYNRFADTSKLPSEDDEALIWFKNYSYWNLKPELHLTWKNSMFDTGLYGSYIFNKDFSSEGYISRGEIGEKFAWHNSYLNVIANTNFVFSNQIKQKFLVPFTLGVTYAFPVYFSNRKLSVAAEGGLLSKQNSVFDLEKAYKFAAMDIRAGETSDWYGKIDFSVPIKSSVTINGDMQYYHTAFENGVFEPIYSDDKKCVNGIYQFDEISRQLLKSSLEFVYHYKLFAVSAGWYASWLDVPALENAQKFALSVSLQDEKSLWGASLSGSYSMDSADLMPWLDFEAFVRLNNAVRLVLTVNDGIKLITGQKRIYAGDYIAQSGSANLLVKFFF